MLEALCDKHRRLKGYYSKTLRGDVKVADKCDCCDETKGVLSSSEWRVSPNGKHNIVENKTN